jgi:hypothetical protein
MNLGVFPTLQLLTLRIFDEPCSKRIPFETSILYSKFDWFREPRYILRRYGPILFTPLQKSILLILPIILPYQTPQWFYW